jgi:hypothetical protein
MLVWTLGTVVLSFEKIEMFQGKLAVSLKFLPVSQHSPQLTFFNVLVDIS